MRIRQLAREVASATYQGSRILQIHLFDMCTASPGDAYTYLTGVNLITLVRQCFRGSAHNWCPTVLQPGTPHGLQRDHVDAVIRNWRAGPEFEPIQIPANANNVLTEEVNHWVNTNLVVYSSMRTVLQHCQRLVNWEFNEYGGDELRCNKHASGLLERRLPWVDHVVNGHVCNCSRNALIPWLVNQVAGTFPLAEDGYVVAGALLFQCCLFSFCHSL